MSEKNSGKWQLAFWIVTAGLVLITSVSTKGYFKLDAKIANAEEKLTKERKEDVGEIKSRLEKLESKIEKIEDNLELKIDHLVDKFQSEQKESRKEQTLVNNTILSKLDQIRHKQN